MAAPGQRVRKHIVVAVAIAVGSGVLSGCGVQTLASYNAAQSAGATALVQQQAPDGEKAAPVIDAIKPDAAIAATVPDAIRAKGLTLSTSVGYPPMEIYAPDGQTIVGVDPAIGLAIARVLGLRLTVTNEDFNAQIPGVLTGRYDLVMSSMSDTKERQAKVTFVDYVSAGAGFLVKHGNPDQIKAPADMCGHTLSVVDNGSSLMLAEKYNKACVAEGKPAIDLLRMTGDQDALLALKSGRAQLNITDYVVAASKAADPKEGVDAVTLKGTESPWGIAMNPQNKALIDAVQAALTKLIESGDYAKILQAWQVPALATDKATINGATS
ncbi:MAG: ABC transporter substrate-binding protein [Intrasporangium sp.]|uniref:ABC transporter substrate-binding protein n=1 Tax=Intrasporangium sp. TaxID=1925024 RepID=UPI00264946B0|nr:ABC transporter substrate-binding protein [Intrasporangium sp.]MDN5796041.1 ABC transporter substrate-binding protein [Intrasporangium sp.]